MRDIQLGQYYAVNSPIHRLDPRIKMFAVIVIMVSAIFINTFFMFGVAIFLVLVVALTARLPLLRLLNSLKLIVLLMLFSLVLMLLFSAGDVGEVALLSWWRINIYQTALVGTGRMAVRLVLLMLAPTVLTLSTTPTELTGGIESFLKPLALIKIPVYVVTLIMNIALSMLPNLYQETQKIINAQKARGGDFDSVNIFKRAKSLASILIPLFINSMRRAFDLAEAMDSRCFRGGSRTSFKKLRLRWQDILAFVLIAAYLFFVLLINYNWWNFNWIIALLNTVY